MGLLGNIANTSLNSDVGFANISSSVLKSESPSFLTKSSLNKFQKLPVAMATNEYIHVWFKGSDQNK